MEMFFRFTTGDWKHDECMDLVMHVTKVSFVGPSYSKLKVRWLVKRADGSLRWPGLSDTRVKILKSEYGKWKRYG